MISLVDAVAQLKDSEKAMEEALASSEAAKKELGEAQKTCGTLARKNIADMPLYKALCTVRDELDKLCKTTSANYCEWYRCGPDGDDVDFSVPYPETEELLSPMVQKMQEIATNAYKQAEAIFNAEEARLYDEIEGPKKKAYDEAQQHFADCQEAHKRALEQLKWGCPELIMNGTDIDKIANIITDSVDKSYDQSDFFIADKESVTINGTVDLEASVDVDIDDMYETASEIPGLDLDSQADNICDNIYDALKEAFPNYNFDITYEITDQDYDGDTYHRDGYYENDTGYGEPEGDYYSGTVTNFATLQIEITITKEEK